MATQSQQPLALDYTAHGAAKGWRANEHLIDALPYIDHVTPELRPQVDALIEEEKRRGTKLPSDYLRELPPVRAPHFDEHPVLKTEYERVRSKQPMAPLDTVRYRLDPPPQTKRGDVGAWRCALENAHAQLEHQHLRILNQELLLKHGDKAWRAQVQLDEAAVKSLESQLGAIRKETDTLNRERKLQQHAAGSELSKLERQYLAQVRKNFDIERACEGLQREVDEMEERLQKRIRADTAQAGPAPQAEANGTAEAGPAEGLAEGPAAEQPAEAAGAAPASASDGDTEMAPAEADGGREAAGGGGGEGEGEGPVANGAAANGPAEANGSA